MERKRGFLPGKMSALHRTMLAAATGLAIASSAVALVPAVQITSGFMTTSRANVEGEWTLAGTGLSAGGRFVQFVDFPAAYFSMGPQPLGTSLRMSWPSDSVDGFHGQMLFDGVEYSLESNLNSDGSFMLVDASPIVLSHAGSYMEPFTYSAKFCGFLTIPMQTCDATANLVGMGVLDLVVLATPHIPGSVDIQSLSYRFSVPEPASIALLLTGLVGLGLIQRRVSVRQG